LISYFFGFTGAIIGCRLSLKQGHNIWRALPDGLLGVALGLIVKIICYDLS